MTETKHETAPNAAVATTKAHDYFTFNPQPVRVNPETGKPYEQSGTPPGWVGLRGSKTGVESGLADDLDAAGVEVGHAYLVVDGTVVKREAGTPFEFHLLKLERFWTRNKPGGNEMVDASVTPMDTPELREKGWREHLFVVLAVKVGDTYRAATGKFRSGQTRAFNYLQTAIEKNTRDPAAKAQFGSLGSVTKRALDAAIPGGVLLAKLWCTEEDTDGGTFILSHEKHRANPDPDQFNRWFAAGVKDGGDLRTASKYHESNVGEVRDLIANKAKAAAPAATPPKK